MLIANSSLVAQVNLLQSVKVISLPDKSVRLDFHFAHTIEKLPTTSIKQNPSRIILNFMHSNSELDNSLNPVTLEPLSSYNISSKQEEVEVTFNLSTEITYASRLSDKIYSLTLKTKMNPLMQNHSEVLTAKPISLNFQNIPIRSVLQILAEFTGFNVIVSEQVTGNTTLRLNNIPWDQALDLILKNNSLDKQQIGKVIMIAPIAEIIKREQDKMKTQQEVGNLAALESHLMQINYAKAADIATLIKDKNNSLLSRHSSLTVDVRTNTIWIQDNKARMSKIKSLIEQLDVPVKQVLIEARIVNINKEAIVDLGIRFGVSKPPHLSGTLKAANQLAQSALPAHEVPFTERLNFDLAATSITSPASLGLALAKLGNGILLDLELSALESEGKGEIIANPRLMTTNQQAAVIESGEEIPYQESTASGATAVAFRKAVLSLKVTPQITADNRLLMDIQINQDADSGKRVHGVPIITTKQLTTNVLVNNGQTVVLGGIYKQDKNNNITRVPFFGNLPYIGVLFRNQHTQIKNEELLIFITPRIIPHNLSARTIEGQR